MGVGRGRYRRRQFIQPDGDPRSFRSLIAAYLEALRVRNYSEATINSDDQSLGYFVRWCDERELKRPSELTRPIVERYQRYLFYYRKKNGRPLGATAQHYLLSRLRGFYRWLMRNGHLLSNPVADIELPRQELPLPKAILSPAEAGQVLNQPDTKTLLGIRDRAILETLYSTGMRRSEAAALSVLSINQEHRTVMIRKGKGKKDRLIPIGEQAVAWVEKYLLEVRPRLATEPDEGVLFLSSTGRPLVPDELTDLARRYVKASGVGKEGACHLFRHSAATAMLDNGADIRIIQELLGHASLESTQIYTHLSIQKLREVHAATHPTAKLERLQPLADAGDLEQQRADLAAALVDDEPEST